MYKLIYYFRANSLPTMFTCYWDFKSQPSEKLISVCHSWDFEAKDIVLYIVISATTSTCF